MADIKISRLIADMVSGITAEKLPEDFRGEVSRRITDFVAAAAAGLRVNRSMCDCVLKVLKSQDSCEQASLIFADERLSAANAAYYNAFVANSADMDDGHMLANGHPGITTIPPVLALGQMEGLPYEQMALAITVGYEVYIRISEAIMPSHQLRGFNGTGTAGTIAAAVASAKALSLNAEQIHVAIGLAAASCGGLMELNESGQGMKPIAPANAVRNGLLAALFAREGAVGPDAPLDGSKGFFKAFTDELHSEFITEGLGREWQMDSAYIKLYPACRHMHAMIDCAALIRTEKEFSLNDIEKADIYTYPASDRLTGSIRHPKDASGAKFSLTYATAVALETGGYCLDDLTSEDEKGEDIISLIDRMEIHVDPSLEDRKAMIRGGRLAVTFRDGTVLEKYIEVPKGEKKFPADESDIRRKFVACCGDMFSENRRNELFDMCMHFDKVTDLQEFMNLMTNAVSLPCCQP